MEGIRQRKLAAFAEQRAAGAGHGPKHDEEHEKEIAKAQKKKNVSTILKTIGTLVALFVIGLATGIITPVPPAQQDCASVRNKIECDGREGCCFNGKNCTEQLDAQSDTCGSRTYTCNLGSNQQAYLGSKSPRACWLLP